MYLIEIAPPHLRGTIAGLYNTFYFIGSILANFTVYGTARNLTGNLTWRLPLWLQMVCPGIVALFIWFCPESPRWLIGKGDLQFSGPQTKLTRRICRAGSTRGSAEDSHQVPRKWRSGPSYHRAGDDRNVSKPGECRHDYLENNLRRQSTGQYPRSAIPLRTMCVFLLVRPILRQ